MIHVTTLLLLSVAFPGGGEGEGKKGDKKPLVTVQCRADAEIRGSEVLLRDLADVRTDDLDLTERLLGVSFGRRPAFGFNRVLSQQDILLRLAREGMRTEQLAVTGARQTVLHPVVTRLLPADLTDVSEPVLRAAIELEQNPDIEFEVVGQIRSITVPPGRFSMELSAKLRGGELQHTSGTVDVSILVDHEVFKVVHVPYRLRRYREILVATKAVRRGERLDEGNLALQRLEAPQGQSPHLSDFAAVQGKVAARDLRAGHQLTFGSLSAPSVIFRGDPVTLVAKSGHVQVATRAVALSDGAVGSPIPVRNLSAGKIVQARVRGRGLVVIETLTGR